MAAKKKANAPVLATKSVKRAPTDAMKKLGPKIKTIASLIGMRGDSSEVNDYVTKVLGKKVPGAMRSDSKHVVSAKHGVEMLFSHEILHDAYPLINVTANSFVPYFSYCWIRDKVAEPVMGVPWDVESEAQVTKILGAPTGKRPDYGEKKPTIPYWTRVLDEGAFVEMQIELRGKGPDVTIYVADARDLEKFVDVTTGLFVGWAATHKLLDESRFAAHADLLASLKKKKIQGSAFVKAAMPRGLWDDHLKDNEELRSFAYGWFHNVDDDELWITKDLKKLFGKRPGKHGHDEPKLDDDTWEAVDKASKIFSDRFKKWAK